MPVTTKQTLGQRLNCFRLIAGWHKIGYNSEIWQFLYPLTDVEVGLLYMRSGGNHRRTR